MSPFSVDSPLHVTVLQDVQGVTEYKTSLALVVVCVCVCV